MKSRVMKIIRGKWAGILRPYTGTHSYRLLNSMDRVDGVQCPAMNRGPSKTADFSSVINCAAEPSRLSARPGSVINRKRSSLAAASTSVVQSWALEIKIGASEGERDDIQRA